MTMWHSLYEYTIICLTIFVSVLICSHFSTIINITAPYLFISILTHFLVVSLAYVTVSRIPGLNIVNVLNIYALACFAVHLLCIHFLGTQNLHKIIN